MTPARLKVVDFSKPSRRSINEIVATGPGAPAAASVEDLSGTQVFVRKTSSYYGSLQELSRELQAEGKPPVDIHEASESLEDDDLLEMVNAGLMRSIASPAMATNLVIEGESHRPRLESRVSKDGKERARCHRRPRHTANHPRRPWRLEGVLGGRCFHTWCLQKLNWLTGRASA